MLYICNIKFGDLYVNIKRSVCFILYIYIIFMWNIDGREYLNIWILCDNGYSNEYWG